MRKKKSKKAPAKSKANPKLCLSPSKLEENPDYENNALSPLQSEVR